MCQLINTLEVVNINQENLLNLFDHKAVCWEFKSGLTWQYLENPIKHLYPTTTRVMTSRALRKQWEQYTLLLEKCEPEI